jgi:hypothetical protein
MSTSTTTIISIRTTTLTDSKAVSSSTIRNIAGMLRMEIGKQPINSADVAPVAPVVPDAPVVPAV